MTTDNTATFVAQHFAQALSLFKTARRAIYTNPPVETDEEQAELDALVDAEVAATNYLMAHEAPDFAAVIAKIEIVAEDTMMNEAGPWLIDIAVDLMRLAGIDRSPTFDPFVWLDQFETRGGRTALADHSEGRGALLSVPMGDQPPAQAAQVMVVRLADYQRAALNDYLLETLIPEDFGLTAAA